MLSSKWTNTSKNFDFWVDAMKTDSTFLIASLLYVDVPLSNNIHDGPLQNRSIYFH